MRHKRLEPETIEAVADRLKVLAEPARLLILNSLRERAMNVSDLVDETGLSQANLSKHLQLLYTHGFVARRRQRLWVFYSIADPSVFVLCDIMCKQLKRHVAVRGNDRTKMVQ